MTMTNAQAALLAAASLLAQDDTWGVDNVTETAETLLDWLDREDAVEKFLHSSDTSLLDAGVTRVLDRREAREDVDLHRREAGAQ